MNFQKIIILIFASVLAWSCSQKNQEVCLIYFNDAHEISPVIDKYGERGGVARLKTVIDKIKKENPECITLFGGDLAGGSLFGSMFRGLPMVEVFNLLPLDVANFGQHDFDFGVAHSLELVNQSDFQWFSSNLTTKNNESFAGVPSHLIREINGIKIGFIGLTDAMNTTTPNAEVIQIELIKATENSLSKLEKENPDVVVAITQTDFETNKNLIDQFPRITAIFTEEVSESVSEVKFIGNRPVIAVCGNMGSAAQLVVRKTGDGMHLFVQIHQVDNTIPENNAFKALQDYYEHKLDSSLNFVIGETQLDLDAGISGDFKCRWKESNLGNLISDAYRAHFQTDIAVMNGGGIRANIPAGKITERNIRAVLPFGNQIVKVELSGHEIRKLLEHGVSEAEKKSGRFLQISGASYSYNPKQKMGERIGRILIGKDSLDLAKTYSIALPQFILDGGDGFTIAAKRDTRQEPAIDVELVGKYLKSHIPTATQTEGRITVLSRKEVIGYFP